MAQHHSFAFFAVEHGQVVLRARGSNAPQRVQVEADGTIVNSLKFGQNAVDHHFVLLGGARFVEFELKNSSGKPGGQDFVIDGKALVGGKATFPQPVQTFVLGNKNTTKSAFQYGFTVVDGGPPITFDPAVRNLGNPHVQWDPFRLGLAIGAIVGAVVALIAVAIFRPPWMG